MQEKTDTTPTRLHPLVIRELDKLQPSESGLFSHVSIGTKIDVLYDIFLCPIWPYRNHLPQNAQMLYDAIVKDAK